jgi:hypothetical protein
VRFKHTHRDANEGAVVDALRAVGAFVLRCEPPMADLLVGFRGSTWVMGVKKPDGPRGGTSAGRGRKNRPSDHMPAEWVGGPWLIVTTPEEAVAAVTGLPLQVVEAAEAVVRQRRAMLSAMSPDRREALAVKRLSSSVRRFP